MGVDISNATWTQNPSTIPDMSKVAEVMATYLLDLLVMKVKTHHGFAEES